MLTNGSGPRRTVTPSATAASQPRSSEVNATRYPVATSSTAATAARSSGARNTTASPAPRASTRSAMRTLRRCTIISYDCWWRPEPPGQSRRARLNARGYLVPGPTPEPEPLLQIEVLDAAGVSLDELAARFDFVAHQRSEHLVRRDRILQRDLFETPALDIHRRLRKLVGVHFAEPLVLLDREVFRVGLTDDRF